MNFTETLTFLENLTENNSSEWVRNNRAAYDSNRKAVLAMTGKLLDEVSAFDHSIEEAHFKPGDCMMRQNRDIRFSKDKAPYKTNCFVLIGKGGKKGKYASYYFSIQPGGNSFAGGGAYSPAPAELKTLKSEIIYNFDEWKEIVEDKKFLKTFPDGVLTPDSYVRIPKEYEEDSPAKEYLRMKGFFTKTDFSDQQMKGNDIVEKILTSFRQVKPMLDFLNKSFT